MTDLRIILSVDISKALCSQRTFAFERVIAILRLWCYNICEKWRKPYNEIIGHGQTVQVVRK